MPLGELLVAVVPTGATTGNVVVTASGVATSGVSFTVLATPTLTSLSFSPTSVAAGTAFTVTSVATGTSADYPITLSGGGDFSVTGSLLSLTGGHQGGCIAYDKGTLSVTIAGTSSNSFSYTASARWAQGDTAASMTAKLASAINSAAGSVVTATAYTSESTYIALASNTTGAGVDYAVSGAVTDTATSYNYFLINPSFTAAAEDMTGGTSAEASQYGTIYSYEAGYAPNGNIVTHTDSVMGTWNFSYDAVDRLMAAQNTAVGSSGMYSGNYGCWSYDAYGNRISESMSTTPCGNNPGLESWASYNTANNRMTSTSYAMGGVTYDAAGNLLKDGLNEYWYDAEGQLCAAQSLSSGYPVQYVYDAEGARIAKGAISAAPGAYSTCAAPTASGSTLTSSAGLSLGNRYLVDQAGEQVTELSEGGGETWTHTNIWSGSRLTATYDGSGLHFELADPLGSRRILADVNGKVQQSCTSLPYGDGESCPTTPTEHLFTGKERDAESGNDYFEARYYSSAMGRFMSPDWSAKIAPVPYAKLENPQSLNLYAYVWNNPLTRFDLDGHDFIQDQAKKWISEHQITDFSGKFGQTLALQAAGLSKDQQPNGPARFSTLQQAQTAGALADFKVMVTTGVHQEWGNAAFQNKDGTYSNTNPQLGGPPCSEEATCNSSFSFQVPNGEVLGDQHSHPWVGGDHQFDGDVGFMRDEGRNYYGYVAGPSSNGSSTWGKNPNVFRIDPNEPSVCKVSGPSSISSCN